MKIYLCAGGVLGGSSKGLTLVGETLLVGLTLGHGEVIFGLREEEEYL